MTNDGTNPGGEQSKDSSTSVNEFNLENDVVDKYEFAAAEGDAEHFDSDNIHVESPENMDMRSGKTSPHLSYTPTKTTSYLDHTQASIAKLTDKTEIPPPRMQSTNSMRNPPRHPPSGVNVLQQSATAMSGRIPSKNPTLQRLRAYSDLDELTTALGQDSLDLFSIRNAARSTSSHYGEEILENTEKNLAKRWNIDTRIGSESLRDDEENEFNYHDQFLRDSLAKARPDLEQNMESRMEVFNNVSQAQDLLNVESSSTPEERVNIIKEKENLGNELLKVPKERDSERMELEKCRLNVHAIKSSDAVESVKDTSQIMKLQTQIVTLENKTTAIGEELDSKTQELNNAIQHIEHVGDNFSSSQSTTEKFRSEVKEIASAILQVLHASSDGLADTGMLENITKSSENFGEETSMLYSNILQAINQGRAKEKSYSLLNTSYEQQLERKDHEPVTTVKALKAGTTSSGSKKTQEQQPWQIGHDTFEKLYKTERQRRQKAEERAENFEKTAMKLYQPDLERKYRELQIDHNKSQDENSKLREKLGGQQELAEQWKQEHKETIVELERRTDGFEIEFNQQRDDMLMYIEEYHKKTQDPAHWELGGLQKRIQSLERDLELTNKLFNEAKTERAKLEDEVKKLIGIRINNEKDIERLGKAWILNSMAPPALAPNAYPGDSSSDCSSNSSSLAWPIESQRTASRGVYIPRAHHSDAIAHRNKKIQEFREAQAKRRQEDEAEMDILEKIRACVLDEKYPPAKKGWRDVLKESFWDKWYGDGWEAMGASEHDMEIVKRMRAKGMI